MQLNIFQAIHELALSLDEEFKRSPFVFKSSDSTKTFKPAYPTIHEFCVPPEDINEHGYPIDLPAIAIIVETITPSNLDMRAHIGIHIAVCNPSTSESEVATGNNETGYVFNGGEGYSQENAYRDLYAACIHLGEQSLNALAYISPKIRLENISMTAPDVNMDDFPFAACVIACDLIYSASYRAKSPEITKLL